MTRLGPYMYEECRREAFKHGPRLKKVNGELRVVYSLTSEELSKVFGKHGYKPKRQAWRSNVVDFGAVWDELTPEESIIMNSDDWSVIFIQGLTDSQILDLKFYAEDQHLPILVAQS